MRNVNVVERVSVGRCLEASEPISTGEILLVEEPLFVSAWGEELKRLAAELFKTLSTPLELPLVTQLFITVLGEIVRGSRAAVLSRLSQLRGHPEQWCQTVGNLHAALREEFGSKLDLSELLDLYSKLAANAHETDDKRAAVYSIGSLAEHSCRPSAFKCVLAKRHTLVIRALSDLATGDIVSLAYIPEYFPTWHRQELLQRSFNFHCGCQRCTEEEPEVVCAFLCPDCASPCCPPRPCRSPGDFDMLLCEECGFRVEDEQLQAFREAERCERLCNDCTPYLHPYHFRIFHMYLGNLQLVSPEQRLDILEQLEDAHGRLGNRVHPLHAKFEELKARCWHLQDDSSATATAYERAAELYALTHGTEAEECRRCAAAAAAIQRETEATIGSRR